LVQPELHSANEGREGDGNPRQPHTDAAAAGVPEAVAAGAAVPTSEGGAGTAAPPLTLALDDKPPAAPVAASAEAGVDRSEPTPTWSDQPAAPRTSGRGSLRLTHPGIRLAQVKAELIAWVKTLISAAVYAVLIVTFGFQVARVEGQSMAPTLTDQDRLIVNKLVYRIGEPRRGDIVMLYYPLNPEKSFVKRVIAEEGDTVRIVDGRVYVNDVPLHDDYVPLEYRSHDDWGPQVIPEGYDFVMGDHRNNSSDSRHWGMVPKKYIIGKVQLRWWPVPTARIF
jgi:signal peptidase I